MTRLSISLFGPLQVSLDGEPVTGFESDKVRALLAYLAIESDAPQRRERLAGLLWPEYPERAARTNLRHVLANLRTAIGDRGADPPFLHITRQTIQFNRISKAQVDVLAFQDLLDPCSAQPTTSRAGVAGPETIRQMEAAAELFRGGFLEGFSLDGCAGFEEWMLFEGERLRRLALETLERLSDLCEQQGEIERALQHAWRQVELDPLREGAHRRVMHLLAQNGRRSTALAQYEVCCGLLAEELGVEPSAETAAMYERIRDEVQTYAFSPAPKHNLPAPLTPLVGRVDELAEIRDRLHDPDCRLLTLVGPGGIGKTRLALEAAANQVDDYRHGVYQVRLAGVQSVEAIVPAMAQALGLSFHGGKEPQKQLLDYLRQKSMLLILDNLEHLLAGVDLIADILRVAPDVTVLATSRSRLNLQGEHLFPVNGLSFPEAGALETPLIAQYDAVELFLASACRVRPGFELEGHERDIVNICRMVQGMPLAILLASAWVEVLAPAEVAAQIVQDPAFLETAWQDMPERHRSIWTVLDHSWHLLAERERRVFQALSVFQDGFDYSAAQVVAGASMHDLRSLVEKSVVHCMPSGRYEVHDLLRRYASQRLDQEAIVRERVHDRHSAYYTAALQQWTEDLHGPRQEKALAAMDVEIENVRAAWDWAVSRKQIDRLAQAMESYWFYLYRRVRLREGEAVCRKAVEVLSATASTDELRVLVRTMAWQGLFAWQLGHREAATQLLRESWTLVEASGLTEQDTQAERAFILLRRGQTVAGSDRERARQFCEQSLMLYHDLGNRRGVATAMHSLGWIAWYSGAHEEAKRLREASLAIRRSLGAPRAIAESLSSLANGALYQGCLEEAEQLVSECVAIRRGIGDHFSTAWALADLGGLSLWSGRFTEASSLYQECVELWKYLGVDASLYEVSMSGAELMRGNYGEANALARIGLTTARGNGDQRAIGLAHLVLGSIALVEARYIKAEGLLQESVAVLQEIEQCNELGWALAASAYAARHLGEPHRAYQYVFSALQVGAETKDFVSLMLAVPAMALLLADRGEKERAVGLYTLASRYPYVGNSRWFEDIVGNHMAAVAASLPSAVVAAAKELGQTCSLETALAELLAAFGGTGLPG